jgi:spermidine synthase
VVARESIVDNIPAIEHASEVAAIHLAQRPEARRFIVAGPEAFSICRRLLALPRTETVVWLDTDPEYPARLIRILPPELAAEAQRIRIPSQDIRQYLRDNTEPFDVVILNLPGNTSLPMNRYFSREFFSDVKACLSPSGMVGVRVSGEENFLGGELVRIGASVFATLESVFANLALKPGGETWLFATDGPALESAPAVLRDRFLSVEKSADLYPPEAILALYPPDRIVYQLDAYRRAILENPGDVLVNTDRHPRSLVYALLFAAREAGARFSLVDRLDVLSRWGLTLAALAALLYMVLRTVQAGARRGADATTSAPRPAAPFDNVWLAFSTGGAGMALGMVLMFLYQAQFGSLFLHVGLVAALFMAGLACGGWIAERMALRGAPAATAFLRAGLLVHMLFAVMLGLVSVELPLGLFACLFFASGFLGGLYLPITGANLGVAGFDSERTGAWLDWGDHLGGCLGGLLAGILLIPVLGTRQASVVVTLLLATNLPAFRRRRTDGGFSNVHENRFRAFARPTAFIAGGVAVFLLISAAVLERAGAGTGKALFRSAAAAMAGDLRLEEREAILPDGTRYVYLTGTLSNGTARLYVLDTRAWVSGINGFGGPIIMAAAVQPDGTLADVRILDSQETPSYLDGLIRPWLGALPGRRLWGDAGIDQVDAVTGATMSSVAIRRTLREAGRRFAASVLGLREDAGPPVESGRMDPWFWLLPATAVAALVLRRAQRPRLRTLFLLVVAVGLGLCLNVQWSVSQLLSLLGLHIPPPSSGMALATVVGVPLVVLLFGNVYCGYLCPFGAFQELAGNLLRRRGLPACEAGAVRRPLAPVRFVLLFLVVVLYAVTRNSALASPDPLVTVFSRHMDFPVAMLVVALLILSLVHRRFWCRYLCPAGAFLSLLNGMRLFRRWFPLEQKRPCVYGFPGIESAECLGCDRCAELESRGQKSEVGEQKSEVRGAGGALWRPERAWGLTLAVVVLALAALYMGRTVAELRGHRSSARAAVVSAAGKPRNVDIRQMKWLIENHRLSGHEALHYRKLGVGSGPDAKSAEN